MYQHYLVLVTYSEIASKSIFLHSKEGITQGYLLAMISYSILILSLIRILKKYHTSATSIWYTNDGNAASTLLLIHNFFIELCNISKDYRYFLEASKSILLMHMHVTN